MIYGVKRPPREAVAVVGALVVVTLAIATATSAVRAVGRHHRATLSGWPAAGRPSPDTAAPVRRLEPLAGLLADHGYELPAGVSVYAAEVISAPGVDVRVREYEGGAGAFDTSFWPASSVKVLVAIGALDFVRTLGFSGAATIESEDGWTESVRDLAGAAIEDSSNEAYDMLVQVAGLDWLNTTFLSPANGFPKTVIQRSYSGIDIHSSPAMTISEDGRALVVPARTSTAEYECADGGNCSDLYELARSVEQVVLDGELPADQRLHLDPQDVRALTSDLQATETFIEPGVKRALGNGAVVYGKPGWVSGLDCVDVGAIDDLTTGRTFLLSLTSPDAGPGCDALPDVAEQVLRALDAV